jgi:hypothetical protein
MTPGEELSEEYHADEIVYLRDVARFIYSDGAGAL